MCGLLLGFRRGDYFASKTRTIGMFIVRSICLENLGESACERLIETVFLCFAYQYSSMMQSVLRWIFCTDFGCVWKITTALLRVLFSTAYATLSSFNRGPL
jgi:hypothetical protein